MLWALLTDLRGDDGCEAELHEAHRRGGWHRSATQHPISEFGTAVDSDAWWAGDLALMLRARQGPAVVCSALDGQLIVVVAGGYERSRLRGSAEAAANRALTEVLDGR